jgi:dolichol-phosphate mannosyltransferase
MSLAHQLLVALCLAQGIALVVVLRRLLPGRVRFPPPPPVLGVAAESARDSVSVVVPARNEGARITPCLHGLQKQGAELLEVIVVDGGSTDDTLDLVRRASDKDNRIRAIAEPPRPAGYVGRPWAIAAGCRAAAGEWVLVVDADVEPRPGMVAGVVAAADRYFYDVVSFAPRINAPTAGAQWLQPAFVATLVFRFGVAGAHTPAPERAMANGQCMLMRRSLLDGAGGYEAAADSFCDDIRMVRHLASRGARSGFLDGRELLTVLMYPTAASTWNGWPRSLNMRDATSATWRVLDSLLLLLALVLPLPILAAFAIARITGWVPAAGAEGLIWSALATINASLFGMRMVLLVAARHSFAERRVAYWLSPLADAPAALRVIQTMLRPVTEWRGAPRTAATPGPHATT